MGNLNFAHNAAFSWYCLLLMFSGITMLVLAVLRNQATRRRVVRAVFGVGFFLYGFYLTFIFGGGSYFVFFQAFIVPVALIIDTIRSQKALRRQPAAQQMPQMLPMSTPDAGGAADPGLPS